MLTSTNKVKDYKVKIIKFPRIAKDESVVEGIITDLNGNPLPNQRCYVWARLVDNSGRVVTDWTIKGVGNSDDKGRFSIKVYDFIEVYPYPSHYEITVTKGRDRRPSE